MKKILLVLGCIALLAMPASAAVQTFSKLKLDVPAGWTAVENSGVVAVIAPQNAAALSVAFDSAGGLSAENLAREMSKALGGTAPTKQEGAYVFTFDKNGVTSTSILVVNNDQYVMFTITDPTGKHDEAIGKIIDSVEEK